MSLCSKRGYCCLMIIFGFLTFVHFGILYFSQIENNFSFSRNYYTTTQNVISTESTVGYVKTQKLVETTKTNAPISINNSLPEVVTRNNSVNLTLTEEQESTLHKQYLQNQAELKDYEFKNRTLNSLLLDSGGFPLRTIVFTTWRSGSNFLGQILEQNPATFYYSEPLAHHGWVQFRNGTEAEEAIQELKDMLNCEYTNLHEYIKFSTQMASWVFSLNTRVGQHCQKSATKRVCANPTFLTRMCKLFPFQAIKLTRMRLSLGRWLLEDPRMNARLIYLIRDPRGSLQSRRLSMNSTFCPGAAVCSSAELLCNDLQDDYETAKQFTKEFPDRFMIVRYENLALGPIGTVRRIYNFSQWEFNYKIQTYVEEHTRHEEKGDFSLFRESQQVVFKWREKLDWPQVESIQSQCYEAITSWGYKLVQTSDELKSFIPLDPTWSI